MRPCTLDRKILGPSFRHTPTQLSYLQVLFSSSERCRRSRGSPHELGPIVRPLTRPELSKNQRLKNRWSGVASPHEGRRSTCEPLSTAPRGGLLEMLQKGGDPAAGSPTATLLRLRPSHQARLRPLPPYGWHTDFGRSQLPWRDGRCVQGPGTDSPWRS